jgi:hypothetical protein
MQGLVSTTGEAAEFLGAAGVNSGDFAPLSYKLGPLITAPELVPLYWDRPDWDVPFIGGWLAQVTGGQFWPGDVSGMQSWLTSFADYLSGGGSPVGQEPVGRQYGVYGASIWGWWWEHSAPDEADEAAMRTKIEDLQAAGNLPPFSPNRLFLIFTKGVKPTEKLGKDTYGTGWCAYHSSWGEGKFFAVMPFPETAVGCVDAKVGPTGSWQSTTSHEILEACTDPRVGRAWLESDGEEGGDNCGWKNASVDFGTVQRFDDNRNAACSVWTSLEVARIAACASDGSSISAIHRGTDGVTYRRFWDGASWTPALDQPWESLGGSIYGCPEVLAWQGNGANNIEVLVRGEDAALYHKFSDGSGWSPSPSEWLSLGGLIVGTPAGAHQYRLNSDSHIFHAFAVGLDQALWYRWWLNSEDPTEDWHTLGGQVIGRPAILSWGPDRLDVFVVGTLGGDVWHRSSTGTWSPEASNVAIAATDAAYLDSYHDWESLGGPVVGPLAAVSWAPQRLDVFGRSSAGTVLHKWWAAPAAGGVVAYPIPWQPSLSGWEDLGGNLSAPPAVVSWGANRIDILARDVRGGVWQRSWDGASWSDDRAWALLAEDTADLGAFALWTPLDGTIKGAPVAIAPAPNRIDLFAQGMDDAMWHRTWDGAHWTDWESLGGVMG